jgi:hypothetical protein
MMSKIFLAALVCALGMAQASFATEPNPPVEFQFSPSTPSSSNPWPAIKPSGLRFVDPTLMSVQTGLMQPGGMVGDGMVGGGMVGGAPCGVCGHDGQAGMGPCVYWTLLPWYGTWGGGGHHGACGQRAACRCGGATAY